MADVFISYSQKAPEPTVALAGDLARAGYAFWYDTSLVPADVFWKVIMRRITDAKAVIVVWSPASVESEWVYSEAKLAHEQGRKEGRKKLICVRTPDCPIDIVPLPFNGYNVCAVEDTAKIFAALGECGLSPAMQAVAATPADIAMKEISLAWTLIEQKNDPKFFDAFLRQYGSGNEVFRLLAEERLRELGRRGQRSAADAAASGPSRAMQTEIDAAADSVILRIDPGMHTASIRRISVTADEQLMATSSHDKTVRLWALPEGNLLRTIRSAIGDGDEGKVYCVALDPTGRWVAAGGWDAIGENWVRIFDAQTGAVVNRLGPLPNVVLTLETSGDGRRIAAGLGHDGVRVWTFDDNDWTSAAEIFEDRGFEAGVYGIDFAPDGRLAVSCESGKLKVFGADLGVIAQRTVSDGNEPFGIAFNGDGTLLAVGYSNRAYVSVLNPSNLETILEPRAPEGAVGEISSVAWLTDGRLAAGGTYSAASTLICVWEDGGRGSRTTWEGPDSTIMSLIGLKGGKLLFGSQDPAFGLISAQGEMELWRGSPSADMRGKTGKHFLVSPDGKRLKFGLKPSSEEPFYFDLGVRRALAPELAGPDLRPPDTTSLKVENWDDHTDPRLKVSNVFGTKDVPLKLRKYEVSYSLAIAPDKKFFLLGSLWSLRSFSAAGEELWERSVPSVAWGVQLAREGKLIIAAYGDGTIRWHRASDGEELLALFIHLPSDPAADKQWILFTPKGYYDCSPGADSLIGWHLNRGANAAADFYPAETFATTFKKPAIIDAALDGV